MAHITRRAMLAASLIGMAGTARAADPVRISSKIDSEGELLGSMMLQLLGAAGIPTVNRLRLGNTRIVRAALLAGEIDLYPEYTGNGAFFFHVDSDPVWKNAAGGEAKVRALDAANNITWLAAAPANNTWAIGVRGDLAEKAKLASLEDLASYVNGGGKIRLAGSAEFMESPAALPAFQTAYGFKLTQDQLLVLAGGGTAASEKAAAEGTSGVNATMVFGTDGAIEALGLVVLKDTKSVQMVYEPAPTIRAAVLAAYPKIPELLAPAFAALDEHTLRRLNAQIEVDGQEASKVATEWLRAQHLLK
jgi:osmoprotectant transport system substrate-binding protein